MNQINEQIKGAVGSHAVYLAVKHDAQLKESFVYYDGKLLFNGKRMLERDYAHVHVYLTGKYGIRTKNDELRAGILAAAAAKDGPSRRRGGRVPPRPETVEAIKKWLKDNEPSPNNHRITTKNIGLELFPAEWESSRRKMEMEIGVALRNLGLNRWRIARYGERCWRWYR